MTLKSKVAIAAALAASVVAGSALAQGMGPQGQGRGMMMGGGMVMDQCKAEIAKYCAQVPHGAGGVPACLQEHNAELSDQCKTALSGKGPGMHQGMVPGQGRGMMPGQGRMPDTKK